MTTLTASKARVQLYKLLDKTASSHEPVQITGRRNNAVLLSEEDWRAIQETLYLVSIPGMRESIRRGLKTPIGKCREKLRRNYCSKYSRETPSKHLRPMKSWLEIFPVPIPGG